MRNLFRTFLNRNGSISIGRTTFVILLFISIANFWAMGLDIPPNLYMTLATVLVYELGKKGRDTYETVKNKTKEEGNES